MSIWSNITQIGVGSTPRASKKMKSWPLYNKKFKKYFSHPHRTLFHTKITKA